MSGLDYSNVYEPNYDKKRLKQAKDITEHIKKVSEIVLNKWKNKNELGLQKFKSTNIVTKPKQIFYDTDGILENQTQNFTRCNKCSGVNWINSKSDSGYRVIAITIPRDGCSSCLNKGYSMYKNPKNAFTNIYLQDKVNDKYYSK